MTQSTLGEKLGITFQQVQKYETGTNRISASTLYRIAATLGTTVGYYFEELPKPERSEKSLVTPPPQTEIYFFSQEGRKLSWAIAGIPKPVRSRLISLVMVLTGDIKEDED